MAGEPPRISERFVWGGVSPQEQDFNLAGQCVSHYGTEGLTSIDSVSLNGVSLQQTRRLLAQADMAGTLADWQGTGPDNWNEWLAEQAWVNLSVVDACAATLAITDAQGHRRRFAYDVAGLPKASWVAVADGPEQIVVKACSYCANGHKLREEHGNQVLTTYGYEVQTERLARIRTERPAGHPAGAMLLQDLHYEYDPCGNVRRVTNEAQAIRFWRNQRVAPETVLEYDSLYQLVSATGREMAAMSAAVDDVTYTRYQRSYSYDAAGNLLRIHHTTPATGHAFNLSLVVSECSNRALSDSLVGSPAEVEALFTAGGQQKVLSPGQTLAWTPRGHLAEVTSAAGDLDEHYRYDSRGLRVLKTGTRGNVSGERCHYLPQLELRTLHNGARANGQLQVLLCDQGQDAQVRLLHWVSGKPDEVANDQLRFSYVDRLGSGMLELDQHGLVLSREEYYPYGGTAVWAASSQVEGEGKTIRYSGKERDATGLYYYGQRYYQPWLGRWLGADPAGTVDGLNLFRAMRNNPVTFEDVAGLVPVAPEQVEEKSTEVVARGGPDVLSLPHREIRHLDPYHQKEYAFIAADLGEHYRLYMDKGGPSDNLVITADGATAFWLRDIPVEKGQRFGFFTQHGQLLEDPGIGKLMRGSNKVFVLTDGTDFEPRKQEAQDLLAAGRTGKLSGSRKAGFIADYSLFKFADDNADVLATVLSLNRSEQSDFRFDVLTVRRRRALPAMLKMASLSGALSVLKKNGFNYSTVYASFCRGVFLHRAKSFDPTRAKDI